MLIFTYWLQYSPRIQPVPLDFPVSFQKLLIFRSIQSSLLSVFMKIWRFLVQSFHEGFQEVASMALYEGLTKKEQRKYNFLSGQRDIYWSTMFLKKACTGCHKDRWEKSSKNSWSSLSIRWSSFLAPGYLQMTWNFKCMQVCLLHLYVISYNCECTKHL